MRILENFIKNKEVSQKGRLVFVFFTFLLSMFYDILFWQKSFGVNLFILTFFYIVFFSSLLLWYGKFKQKWALFFAFAALLVSLAPFLHSNSLGQIGAPIYTLILISLFSVIAPVENPDRFNFYFLKLPFFSRIEETLFGFEEVIKDVLGSKGQEKNLLKRIILGVLISIPILFIFGILFYQADEIFAQWVRNLHLEKEDFWRFIRTFILTFFISGLFYSFLKQKYTLGKKELHIKESDHIVTSVVLLLVNLLFAFFVYIQVNYLFGGKDFLFSSSYTYAEYAKKGFNELVAVVVFSSLLILTVYRFFSYKSRVWFLDILQTILSLQVFVVGISAIRRLNLYQAEYGFTVIRFYSEWFLYTLLLLLGLGIVLVLLRVGFKYLIHSLLVLGGVVMVFVMLVNADFMIAKRNVDRFLLEGKSLDIFYMEVLSEDVIPVYTELLENKEKFGGTTGEFGENSVEFLTINSRVSSTIKDLEDIKWQEYSMTNLRIKKALKDYVSIENK